MPTTWNTRAVSVHSSRGSVTSVFFFGENMRSGDTAKERDFIHRFSRQFLCPVARLGGGGYKAGYSDWWEYIQLSPYLLKIDCTRALRPPLASFFLSWPSRCKDTSFTHTFFEINLPFAVNGITTPPLGPESKTLNISRRRWFGQHLHTTRTAGIRSRQL